jgi:hypothetical protein
VIPRPDDRAPELDEGTRRVVRRELAPDGGLLSRVLRKDADGEAWHMLDWLDLMKILHRR